MGSFSLSCGMSGLSMQHTDAVLFPLIPNRYEGKDGKFQFNQHNIVSNEGSTALFEPCALPIFGELGEYGTLDSIEEDYNTRALEARFGKPILEIAEEFSYPTADAEGFPQYRTGMLVHRKVWDKFSVPGLGEFGEAIELKDYKGTSNRDIWHNTIRLWKQRRESDLRAVEMFREKQDEDAVALFSRVSYHDLQYILSFGSGRDVEALLEIYPDAMENEDFYVAMEKLFCFRWNMMACNRMFMPTYNGYQDGNFFMSRELAKLTLELAQEEIGERGSDED